MDDVRNREGGEHEALARELREAVERQNFERARQVHEMLSSDPAWKCHGEAMKEAVCTGDEVFIKWHLAHCSANDASWLMPLAAKHGCVEVLEHLYKSDGGVRLKVVQESILTAVKEGSLKAIKWFHENVEMGWPTKLQHISSKNGRLEILQYLHEHRRGTFWMTSMAQAGESCQVNTKDEPGQSFQTRRTQPNAMSPTGLNVDSAAAIPSRSGISRYKFLSVKEYYSVKSLPNQCPSSPMDGAAGNGHLDVIEWLHANQVEGWTTRVMDAAARNGHLKVVQWLHANRSEGCTVNAMDAAATNGHVDVVEWLHTNRSEGCTVNAMDAAARNGHLKVVQWLHSNRSEGCTVNAMDAAATNGHVDVVEWLHTNRSEGCTVNAMDAAARNGHLKVVQWLHSNRSEGCTVYAMNAAAFNGHLAVMSWLYTNRDEGCTDDATIGAAYNNHLEVAQWLRSNRLERHIKGIADVAAERGHLELVQWLQATQTGGYTSKAMDDAAKNGHLDIVEWLHENRSEGCTTGAMDKAARNGHLNVVKWLHENRSEGCTTGAMDDAAENGHLDIVIWLHENRSEGCTTGAMDKAARNGHLNVVKWLHENRSEGCTTGAMDEAAENGHLDIVKWLHTNREEGCTVVAVDWAARNGHLELVVWLGDNRSEGCTTDVLSMPAYYGHLDVARWFQARHMDNSSLIPGRRMDNQIEGMDAVTRATRCGRVDVLQWLHVNQKSKYWPQAMDNAAENGHLDVVQWLHANRSEGCTTGAMDRAAKNGHLDVLKWLHANRSEGCTTGAMDRAAKNGHLDVLKWLHANRSEGCTTDAMDGAAGNGHLDALKWLHANRPDGCTRKAMNEAAGNGHLDVLKWLHANRPEGCTRKAMNEAAGNGHFDVVRWLNANRSEGCSKKALDSAEKRDDIDMLELLIQKRTEIKCSDIRLCNAIDKGQLRIVRAIYDREEMTSWPQPYDVSILVNLLQSNDQIDASIFRYIVAARQERYDASNNPYQNESSSHFAWSGKPKEIQLASVVAVCEHGGLLERFKADISEFITGHPSRAFSLSVHPSEELDSLADCGDFVGARFLHNLANRDLLVRDRHPNPNVWFRCSKRFLYTTMKKSDLVFLKWHMQNCQAHSFEEWVYASVWVGRTDVTEWMRQDQTTNNLQHDGITYTLFDSRDASFETVAARLESEQAKAAEFMKGSGRTGVSSRSIDMISLDLAAINSEREYSSLQRKLHKKFKGQVGCTVTGLCGAIINGHIKTIRKIYETQPELANWPKCDDGPDVLHRFLEPFNEDMLRYFQTRGMRIRPQDLNEAVFCGNFRKVERICELDLVAPTSFTLDLAAVQGDCWMLRNLCDHMDIVSWTTRAMDGAAEEGRWGAVLDLHELGAPCSRRAIDLASRNGHVSVVIFLFERRREGCSEWAIYWATMCGQKNVVEFLVSRGVNYDFDKCFLVARTRGYHEIADILEAHRIPNRRYALQRSTRSLARHRVQYQQSFDISRSRVIYSELEREMWPNGIPTDIHLGMYGHECDASNDGWESDHQNDRDSDTDGYQSDWDYGRP